MALIMAGPNYGHFWPNVQIRAGQNRADKVTRFITSNFYVMNNYLLNLLKLLNPLNRFKRSPKCPVNTAVLSSFFDY